MTGTYVCVCHCSQSISPSLALTAVTIWQGRTDGIHFERGAPQTKTTGRGRFADKANFELIHFISEFGACVSQYNL